MPSSAWEHSDFAREKFAQLRQKNPHYVRVLDIGPGSGKWPKVLGERPEVRHDGEHWTGLEVFPRYITDYDLMSLYDRIIVDDVRNLETYDLIKDHEGMTPRYDLIICGDVLEHLKESEARKVSWTLTGCGSALLIAGPIVSFPQGSWGGNDHEAHLWEPTVQDWIDMAGADDHVLGDVIGLFWRDAR